MKKKKEDKTSFKMCPDIKEKVINGVKHYKCKDCNKWHKYFCEALECCDPLKEEDIEIYRM